MFHDTSDLGIDWPAYIDRGRRAEVPKSAEALYIQMRLQVAVLEGALINYYSANQRSLGDPASLPVTYQRLAGARSAAYEAALLVKLSKGFVGALVKEDKDHPKATRVVGAIDAFKIMHPQIISVRDNFAHLYGRVDSERSQQEPTLFAIIDGYAVARDQNGELQRVSLLPKLLHDAIQMVDSIAALFTPDSKGGRAPPPLDG